MDVDTASLVTDPLADQAWEQFKRSNVFEPMERLARIDYAVQWIEHCFRLGFHAGRTPGVILEDAAQSEAVQAERERCRRIIERARFGEIDQDFRGLISRIKTGDPAEG